jgi:hypothetical protein
MKKVKFTPKDHTCSEEINREIKIRDLEYQIANLKKQCELQQLQLYLVEEMFGKFEQPVSSSSSIIGDIVSLRLFADDFEKIKKIIGLK